jgi:hypothetical protein
MMSNSHKARISHNLTWADRLYFSMEILWSDVTRWFLSQTSLTMMRKTVVAKLAVTEKRHNIEKVILNARTSHEVELIR